MIQTTPQFDAANAVLLKTPVYLVEIDSYKYNLSNMVVPNTSFSPWLVGLDDLTQVISDLAGGSDVGTFAFTVQDRNNAITATFPCFTFEGSKVTLKVGFLGMDPLNYALIWSGTIDTIDSANDNADYYITCTDKKQLLSKVIFSLSDDGINVTDSTHLRSFSGHPLDILIAILEDEFGMVPNIDFDLDKIVSYRDVLFNGAQFSFKMSKAPTALDFIEKELMVPLGGYIWTDEKDRLTVNFFFPNNTTPVMTLTRSNIMEIPAATTSPLVNNVTFRFDDDGTGNATFLSEVIVQSAVSINKFGQFGAQTIESQGMKSGLQGYFLARQTASLIFGRYGNKNLAMDVHCFWDAIKVQPGDFVAVTHNQIPDRNAGTLGITSKLFEVKDKVLHFSDGTITLSLIDAGVFSSGGQILIAPDSEADFTSASSGDKLKYMFLSSVHAKYSDGTAANLLG